MRPDSLDDIEDFRARAALNAPRPATRERPDPTKYPFAWFIADAAAADAESLRELADSIILWPCCAWRGCRRAKRCRGRLVVDMALTGERMPPCVARIAATVAHDAVPYFKLCAFTRLKVATGQSYREICAPNGAAP